MAGPPAPPVIPTIQRSIFNNSKLPSADEKPPLCKGRWPEGPEGLSLSGHIQSPSQQADSPLYTRGPFPCAGTRAAFSPNTEISLKLSCFGFRGPFPSCIPEKTVLLLR